MQALSFLPKINQLFHQLQGTLLRRRACDLPDSQSFHAGPCLTSSRQRPVCVCYGHHKTQGRPTHTSASSFPWSVSLGCQSAQLRSNTTSGILRIGQAWSKSPHLGISDFQRCSDVQLCLSTIPTPTSHPVFIRQVHPPHGVCVPWQRKASRASANLVAQCRLRDWSVWT